MSLVTLDFETFYSKEYSLSKLTTEAYVRDPRFEVIGVGVKIDDAPPRWFSGSMEETAAYLRSLELEKHFLLAHNTQFDGFILSHHFGIIPRFYFDTLSMARPKHGMTAGGSLKALSDHYTVGVKGDEVVHALGKRRADFTTEELARYGQYCMNDVQLCYMLFHIMKRDLPKAEIKIIDLLLRMYCDPVLHLDTDLLVQHLDNVIKKKEETLDRILELAPEGRSALMSNQKFAELLRQLGVEPPQKISPTTGKYTFAFAKGDQAFKELLEHEDPRVQALVSARLGVKSTIEETRTKAFIEISQRGALPVPLGYYKAHTGRAAGEDGINLQNLPRKSPLRRAIKPPPGHKVVAGDSSQIEARITAWLAGQDDLIRDFANRADIYSKFASEIYQFPVNKDSNPNERFVGKTCILGLGFGMGPPKLQRTLKAGSPSIDLPIEQCRDIVSLYRRKYHRIPKLWEAGERALWAITRGERYEFGCNGLLHTSAEGIHLPNGMMIRYPSLTLANGEFFYAKNRKEQAEWVKQKLQGWWQPDLLTRIYGGKVIENVVQALARIVVFDQMLIIAQRFKTALTVHDEVVTVAKENKTQDAVEFMQSVMSIPPDWATGLPVACEAKVGETYGDAK